MPPRSKTGARKDGEGEVDHSYYTFREGGKGEGGLKKNGETHVLYLAGDGERELNVN